MERRGSQQRGQAGTCARELLLCLWERRSSSKLATPVKVTRLAAPAAAAALASAPWSEPSWFRFGLGFGPGSVQVRFRVWVRVRVWIVGLGLGVEFGLGVLGQGWV